VGVGVGVAVGFGVGVGVAVGAGVGVAEGRGVGVGVGVGVAEVVGSESALLRALESCWCWSWFRCKGQRSDRKYGNYTKQSDREIRSHLHCRTAPVVKSAPMLQIWSVLAR